MAALGTAKALKLLTRVRPSQRDPSIFLIYRNNSLFEATIGVSFFRMFCIAEPKRLGHSDKDVSRSKSTKRRRWIVLYWSNHIIPCVANHNIFELIVGEKVPKCEGKQVVITEEPQSEHVAILPLPTLFLCTIPCGSFHVSSSRLPKRREIHISRCVRCGMNEDLQDEHVAIFSLLRLFLWALRR